MFKKILAAFDGSNGSRKALKQAIELAQLTGAELRTISVEVDLPHYVATIGEFEEVKIQKDAYFEKLIREAEELAKASGIKLTSHIVVGHAVDSITNFCNENGFDVIVVGFTGHSRIYERIWGGHIKELSALCAVHSDYREMIERIPILEVVWLARLGTVVILE